MNLLDSERVTVLKDGQHTVHWLDGISRAPGSSGMHDFQGKEKKNPKYLFLSYRPIV